MKTTGNNSIRWRSVPDWPEYEVSDTGLVRSWRGPGFAHKKRGIPKNRKLTIGKDGYVRVSFCRNSKKESGTTETWSVHRLVAICFLEGDKNLDVAHLDGNKENNHYLNLKFVTRVENESHKLSHGTRANGEKNGQSKLCQRSINAIKKLSKENKWNQKKIADLFQISQSNVSAILLGKSWFHQ